MRNLIKKLLKEAFLDKEGTLQDFQPYPYTDELTDVFNRIGYKVDHIYPYDNVAEEIPGSIAYDVYIILGEGEPPVPIYLYVNPDGYVHLQDVDKEIMLGHIEDVSKISKTLSYELGPPQGGALMEVGMPSNTGGNRGLPSRLEPFLKFLTIIKLRNPGGWGRSPIQMIIYLTPNNKVVHIDSDWNVSSPIPFKIGEHTTIDNIKNYAAEHKATFEIIKRPMRHGGLNEGTFGDVAKDVLGDLAMGVVGSFDIADATILIPAILKNLRELKVSMDNIDILIPKFNENPEKFKEPLRDEADTIVMDVVDVMQRLVELAPGSIAGSITSFVGGQIAMSIISNTLIKKIGEKYAKLYADIPDALKSKLSKESQQLGMIGFGEIPDALDKAGLALQIIDSYEEYIQQ